VVSVEVEGLGTLTNHIVDGPTPVSTEIGAQPTASEEVLSTALGGEWEFRGQRRPVPTPHDALPSPQIRPKFLS
jgi:5-oxopent-3-ene-1,2,5-tricarboxylate decarboxylase/2-hydroxyhepta-2,4-diene-1,7-dioate isomerase